LQLFVPVARKAIPNSSFALTLCRPPAFFVDRLQVLTPPFASINTLSGIFNVFLVHPPLACFGGHTEASGVIADTSWGRDREVATLANVAARSDAVGLPTAILEIFVARFLKHPLATHAVCASIRVVSLFLPAAVGSAVAVLLVKPRARAVTASFGVCIPHATARLTQQQTTTFSFFRTFALGRNSRAIDFTAIGRGRRPFLDARLVVGVRKGEQSKAHEGRGGGCAHGALLFEEIKSPMKMRLCQ